MVAGLLSFISQQTGVSALVCFRVSRLSKLSGKTVKWRFKLPRFHVRTVLSDVPESQMVKMVRHISRFRIVDQSKFDFAVSMLRIQSEAGLGVNISGPRQFVNMIDGFRVLDDILNIPIHYVYAGEHVGVRQEHRPFDGPIIDWDEFGIEPVDPIDQTYIDLCNGVAPTSRGCVEVVDGVCRSLRSRDYVEDMRSIDEIGKYSNGRPMLYFVVSISGGVFSFLASACLEDLKVLSFTEFSHALISCQFSKISFLHKRDKDFFQENLIDKATSEISFFLSLNPNGGMENLNNRNIRVAASPIDYTCMTLEDGKVSFNYGAGVIDSDMQSMMMPSKLQAHADAFYGRMSACPTTVDKVSLYLPTR